MIPVILRIVHIASAVGLMLLLYPEWAVEATPLMLMRFVAFPLLTLTGVALMVGRIKAENKRESKG